MGEYLLQEILKGLWSTVIAAKDYLALKIITLISWVLIAKDFLVANGMTVITAIAVIFSLLTIFCIVCMRTEWGQKLLIRLQKSKETNE